MRQKLSWISIIIWFSGSFAGTALLSHCASKDVAESNSAEAAFKAAEDYEKDERYDEAITKFNEVKNKHPYSKFAVESELHVADIHYKREAFIEAATAYQLFKDFHPKNPKIDYVTFRLAMSYFEQLPPTADRDLAPATKALQFFTEVINAYPTSPYVSEARQKKTETLRMLAEKEAYIGWYYYKRNVFDSALRRYEGLLVKYPDLGYDEESLYYAAVSAFETGNHDVGTRHIKELLAKFPDGKFSSRGKSALEKYGSR